MTLGLRTRRQDLSANRGSLTALWIPSSSSEWTTRRGCFAILGLWIANIAVLILPLFVFAGTGWTLVAMAIEVAGIVLLGVILYRRRRYKRPSF